MERKDKLFIWGKYFDRVNVNNLKEVSRFFKRVHGNGKRVIRTLEDACVFRSGYVGYEELQKWFIDQKLCDPDTFAWLGGKHGGASQLILYLKDLYKKGYGKQLKHQEIVYIAKNTFLIDIDINTVKRPVLKNYPELPYITPIDKVRPK